MAYGATVVPEILGLVMKHIKLLRRTSHASDEKRRHQEKSLLRALFGILTSGLGLRGFATFCAVLAAGPSFLQVLSSRMLMRLYSF